MCEVELQAALEERDRARNDASHSSLAQEDVVVRAREDRDLAIQRKTKAEVELAKTRVELMQANSQLLEAIQQKVELSQQLEQWQVRSDSTGRVGQTNASFFSTDGYARAAGRAAEEQADVPRDDHEADRPDAGGAAQEETVELLPSIASRQRTVQIGKSRRAQFAQIGLFILQIRPSLHFRFVLDRFRDIRLCF